MCFCFTLFEGLLSFVCHTYIPAHQQIFADEQHKSQLLLQSNSYTLNRCAMSEIKQKTQCQHKLPVVFNHSDENKHTYREGTMSHIEAEHASSSQSNLKETSMKAERADRNIFLCSMLLARQFHSWQCIICFRYTIKTQSCSNDNEKKTKQQACSNLCQIMPSVCCDSVFSCVSHVRQQQQQEDSQEETYRQRFVGLRFRR